MGKIIDREVNSRTEIKWKRQLSNKRKLIYSIFLNIFLGILLIGALLDVI